MRFPQLSAQQMREVDRLMVDVYGIQLIQMMENAGRALADLARRSLGGRVAGARVLVLCGPGNNGGGGMVAARQLHNAGARVQASLIGEAGRMKPVPVQQWRILEKLQLTTNDPSLEDRDLVLDAMLGYGGQGDPRPPIAHWIERVNQSRLPVLALDVPSGLDTDSGRPRDPCMRAHATLTLAAPKTGLLSRQASDYVGHLYVADIGVPPELYARPELGLGESPRFPDGAITRL